MGRTVVYLGGRFVEEHEAVVPVTHRGYLLGEGVFATMRGYDGVCFRASAHLATFARGADLFGLTLPCSLDDLADLADEAAVRTGERDAYVRATLARDEGDGAVLSIVARAFDTPPPATYAEGIDVVTVSLRRVPPECGDATVKTTSYGREVLARREVAARGAFEGVQLAVDGSLASGTMASLFLVRGDDLVTPSLASGCRAGVTRAAVLSLAERVGLRPREERLEPSALARADEIFFASTRVECISVARIDGRPTRGGLVTHEARAPEGRAGFARTHALRAALRDVIRDETAPRRNRRGAS